MSGVHSHHTIPFENHSTSSPSPDPATTKKQRERPLYHWARSPVDEEKSRKRRSIRQRRDPWVDTYDRHGGLDCNLPFFAHEDLWWNRPRLKSTLTNPIHPMFAPQNFSHPSCKGSYPFLRPALRLASRLLTSPPLLPFWHAMFFGKTMPPEEGDETGSYARSSYVLSRKEVLATHAKLEELAGRVQILLQYPTEYSHDAQVAGLLGLFCPRVTEKADEKENDEKGNDEKGNDEKGNDEKGNDEKGNDEKGNDENGNDENGNDEKVNDEKMHDVKVNERHACEESENGEKGNDGEGKYEREPVEKGNNDKGNDEKVNEWQADENSEDGKKEDPVKELWYKFGADYVLCLHSWVKEDMQNCARERGHWNLPPEEGDNETETGWEESLMDLASVQAITAQWAIVLVHEVAHAAHASMLDRDAEHEYYFEDGLVAEAGFDWETWVFGGSPCLEQTNGFKCLDMKPFMVLTLAPWPVEWIENKVVPKPPCRAQELPSFQRDGYSLRWRIDQAFVEKLFTDEFWEKDILEIGREALRPEKQFGLRKKIDGGWVRERREDLREELEDCVLNETGLVTRLPRDIDPEGFGRLLKMPFLNSMAEDIEITADPSTLGGW